MELEIKLKAIRAKGDGGLKMRTGLYRWLVSWTFAGIIGGLVGTFLISNLLGSEARASAGRFVMFMVGWVFGGFIWYG